VEKGVIYFFSCLRVIDGEIEGIGQGRRRKQLLDDIKTKRIYWKLDKKELDCTLEGASRRLRVNDDLDCNPGQPGS
jgi:hypothetical protein